jgi:hypothetical protein
MELHVSQIIIYKMPIILVSAQGPNYNLKDFKTMELVVDIMMESTDPECKAIADQIAQMCVVVHRMPVTKLNHQKPDESSDDVQSRVVSVVQTIRQMKIGTAVIVSHLGVLNSNPETTIDGEWDLMNL